MEPQTTKTSYGMCNIDRNDHKRDSSGKKSSNKTVKKSNSAICSLQDLYSLVLNPLFRVTGKIDNRIRNVIISLCCVFLTGFFIAYYDTSTRETLYLQHGHNNFICSVVLVVLIIFSIKAPLKRVRWDNMLFWLFFSAGLGLVIISFIHPIGEGYRSFGFMMMFLFPCLYYVWNNRGDYNILYIRLAGATSAVGLAFYLKIMMLALSGELAVQGFRVKATFYNANLVSMVGMVMVCSAVYMFFVKRTSRRWFVFAALTFGAGWGIMRMGVSRVSMLVGFGSVFAGCVFWLKDRKTLVYAENWRIQFIRIGCIVIVTILFMFNGEILLNVNTAMQFRQNNEVSAEQGSLNDTEDEETTMELPEEATQHNVVSSSDRFSTKGKNLNIYTAGRINIWKSYAAHLNLLGNDFDTIDFSVMTGTGVKHAHNNFLEYAFRCGIPVALIHILLELYAGIVCIGFLFNKRYSDPKYLFAVIFMVCYTLESLFDIATVPFERHAPFYFYMIMIPVFGRVNDNCRSLKSESSE